MIIYGCDFSTHAEHWALIDSDVLRGICSQQYTKARDIAQRLADLENSEGTDNTTYEYGGEIHPPYSPWSFHNMDWCALEGYVSLWDKEGKMAGVHWNIRRKLAQLKIRTLIIPPHRWKKELGIAGNANKDAVKEFICQLYPDIPKNLAQDCYDAVGIARAAHKILVLGDGN